MQKEIKFPLKTVGAVSSPDDQLFILFEKSEIAVTGRQVSLDMVVINHKKKQNRKYH